MNDFELKMPLALRVTFALAALATTTLFDGCASPPADEQATAGTTVCKRTYMLGSNIPTTTCVTAEQAAEDQKDRDAVRLRAPVPARLSTGGAGG